MIDEHFSVLALTRATMQQEFVLRCGVRTEQKVRCAIKMKIYIFFCGEIVLGGLCETERLSMMKIVVIAFR